MKIRRFYSRTLICAFYFTASATALLLMADWLSDHSETTDKPIRGLVTEVYDAFPRLSEVGRRESCDLCEGNIL